MRKLKRSLGPGKVDKWNGKRRESKDPKVLSKHNEIRKAKNIERERKPDFGGVCARLVVVVVVVVGVAAAYATTHKDALVCCESRCAVLFLSAKASQASLCSYLIETTKILHTLHITEKAAKPSCTLSMPP